jgi:glycosyltransferase involved in cell wall biosynthesis
VKDSNPKYVLVTPAYNESLFIEKVCQSVLSQTIQPSLWVIVDDDSSDQTAEIAGRYARCNGWIVLLNASDTIRAFPSKVYSFNVGYEFIKKKGISYDFICSLDADISFGPDYFEYLLDNSITILC